MADIQIDMFEVQLGAAILLQFVQEGRTVRVLADAGVKASQYKVEHVRDKLLEVLKEGDRRIDLIIGTHYDEDHLRGLVPIINDERFTFGEAWMPPVINDTVPHAIDQRIDPSDFLAFQFYDKDGSEQLRRYLGAKRVDCNILSLIEGAPDRQSRRTLDTEREGQRNILAAPIPFEPEECYFREQLSPSDDADCNHGIDQEIEHSRHVAEAVSEWRAGRILSLWHSRYDVLPDQAEHAKDMRAHRPDIWAEQARSLANIRKAAAKDAINAKSLHDVVQALAARKVPIRCEVIEDGKPRRYLWDETLCRFIASVKVSTAPEFKLLGPSRSLVRKHWDRLPVQDSAAIALSFRMEIKQITPSNQLSYIGRFGYRDQGILISGDAGCVDFKQTARDYFPDLLAALTPLHVVQVAHHAGNNAHFYRVLDASKFPNQAERSLMLISHATHDAKRPSAEFAFFLLSTLRQGDDVQLLFTSEPSPEKVQDYRSAIYPAVGTSADRGDIRILYSDRIWTVAKHAIDI